MENIEEITELIVSKIHGELSEEEEKKFSKIIKDEKNKEMYQSLKKIHSSMSMTPRYSEREKNLIYKNLKLQSERKRNLRIIFTVAASILLLVSLTTILPFLKKETTYTQLSQNFDNIAKVGSNKAYLVLSNGNKIDLSRSDNFHKQLDNSAKIILKDSSLTYKSLNKEQEYKKKKTNTLVVPRGGEYKLTLSDGTKVWLNSETKLEYPVTFNGKTRTVKLIGEAYFDVAKDSKHPFIVHMDKSSVKVLGTEFNISAYPDSYEETVLVEGKVNLSSNGKNKILKPGDRAVSVKGDINISKVNTKFYTSWKNGIFYFNNIKLKDLVVQLSRWYDVEFFFLNEEIKGLHFTGAVEKDRSIKFILDLISNITHVDFRVKGKGIVVQYNKQSRKNW